MEEMSEGGQKVKRKNQTTNMVCFCVIKIMTDLTGRNLSRRFFPEQIINEMYTEYTCGHVFMCIFTRMCVYPLLCCYSTETLGMI